MQNYLLEFLKFVFIRNSNFFSKLRNNKQFNNNLTSSNIYGNRIGRITASCRAFLASSNPAISSHLTLGFSVILA